MAVAIPLMQVGMMAASMAGTGMAMANGNKSSNQQQGSQSGSSQQQTVFSPRSLPEERIQNLMQNLGEDQLGFIRNLMNSNTSPYTLSAADQAQLDKSYEATIGRFNQEGRDMADYLATTRGLNKSDTPVGQQVMDRYGMGMADILSNKADSALNLGLQGTNLKLNGAQITPSGLMNAFNPYFSERMQSGITFGNQTGNSSGSFSQTPSMLTTIGQGMGVMQQGIGLGAQMGGFAGGGAGGIGKGMTQMGGGGGTSVGNPYRGYGLGSSGSPF